MSEADYVSPRIFNGLRWEYRIETSTYSFNFDERLLNDMGRDGWENYAVMVSETNSGKERFAYYFRRSVMR